MTQDRRSFQLSTKAIGIPVTSWQEMPYIVTLGIHNDNGEFIENGGGTIIDVNSSGKHERLWILTAGHTMNQPSVAIGFLCLKNVKKKNAIPICRRYRPKDYYRGNQNDISLLEVEADRSSLPDTIRPLKLPTDESTAYFNKHRPEQLLVAGWGTGKVLQKAVVQTNDSSSDECKDLLNGYKGLKPRHVICTKGSGDHVGVVQVDDSGGPIVWKDELVGLLFLGNDTETPDTHLRVHHHLESIRKIMNDPTSAKQYGWISWDCPS